MMTHARKTKAQSAKGAAAAQTGQKPVAASSHIFDKETGETFPQIQERLRQHREKHGEEAAD